MKFLFEELVKPLARRLGSIVAGGALTLGATSEQAASIEMATIAILTVVADLVLSYRARGVK